VSPRAGLCFWAPPKRLSAASDLDSRRPGPLFIPHVPCASPPSFVSRLHRALPAHQRPAPARGRAMAARSQAGWLSDDDPPGRCWHPAANPQGYDWTSRFPQIAAAVNALRCRSCLIDGEAVC
jgi:hypothetical protein